MKWFFLFVMRGFSIYGPYNTEQECTEALKTELSRPINDQEFDHTKSFGMCLQAVAPGSNN
jgi:hypothetical protein